MSRLTWKESAEMVGILAIVGSLLFVGYQLRQERQIAQAQITLDYQVAQIEMSNLISENSDVWVKGLRNDDLTDAEQAIFESIVHAIAVKYDSMYDRAKTNLGTRTVPEEIPRQLAMHIYSHPGLRRAWNRRCTYLNGITGNEIPPCARVRAELVAIEDGRTDAPVGGIFTP